MNEQQLQALARELHKKALDEISLINDLVVKRETVTQDNPWYSTWWVELEKAKARCRVLLNQKEELLRILLFNPEYY